MTTQQLIMAGADPDVVDHNGQTPIFYAIRYNKYDMVEYLIQRGVRIKIEDKRNQTLSHWAKKHQKPQILELLMRNGAV